MKNDPKIIEMLNGLLAVELTAINQYIVHSEMCENWKYKPLHDVIRKRAIDEMKHAETLIARIFYFEGRPIVSTLNKINIGAEVPNQLDNDLTAESDTINAYNKGIKLAAEMGDNGTREILESILREEEVHIDWIEAQKSQLKQIGVENYLSAQVG